MTKRLYRSRTNRMLGGVCGGIADYFEIDPTIIRLGWVVLSLPLAGILAYLICLIVVPNEPFPPTQ